MAIYHLSTKPISRKSGRSATASSAYRSGERLEDKRTGKTHDYTKRTGVVENACFMFKDGEKIKLDRSQVWNKSEETEKRKDSRTAREIVINLPHELDKEQRSKLVAEFAENVAKKYNVAIDYAIHLPDKQGDQRNHHAHIMMTTREVCLDKNNNISLGDKTAIELGNKDLKKLGLPSSQEQIKDLRAEWASLANHHLEMAGIAERIDHRSLEEQGSNYKPTIKMGWKTMQAEAHGIATRKGNINRAIRADNQMIANLEHSIANQQVRLQVSQEFWLETQIEKLEQSEQNKQIELEKEEGKLLLEQNRAKYLKIWAEEMTEDYFAEQQKVQAKIAQEERERLQNEKAVRIQQERDKVARNAREEQIRRDRQQEEELFQAIRFQESAEEMVEDYFAQEEHERNLPENRTAADLIRIRINAVYKPPFQREQSLVAPLEEICSMFKKRIIRGDENLTLKMSYLDERGLQRSLYRDYERQSFETVIIQRFSKATADIKKLEEFITDYTSLKFKDFQEKYRIHGLHINREAELARWQKENPPIVRTEHPGPTSETQEEPKVEPARTTPSAPRNDSGYDFGM